MKRAYYDARPKALEAVGNGDYLYHWDIQEETVQNNMREESGGPFAERTQYSCLEAVIHGEPAYGKCVEGVIRTSFTVDEELAMVNKYNAYRAGIIADESIVAEYQDYLRHVAEVKAMVKHDLGIG